MAIELNCCDGTEQECCDLTTGECCTG